MATLNKLEVKGSYIQQLIKKIDALKGKKLLVIGDSGLDEYVFGKVRRISPEAPVPVVEVTDEASQDFRLGLSTNVAQNIQSLGGTAQLVSVIGQDESGDKLKTLLEKNGISSDYLVTDKSRPTTRKLRVMSGQHHLVRVDFEHQRFLSADVQHQLVTRVGELVGKSDGVIIQDYAKGVISESCVQDIVHRAHKSGKQVFGDPHRSVTAKTYAGIDLMTPNFDEALALSGLTFSDLKPASESLQEVADAIREKTNAKNLVITRGKDGMTLYQGTNATWIPTFARQVFDVTGAGDTVIAAMAMASVAGLSLEEACLIGNYAAGVVVGKIGCVPCSHSDLTQFMQSHL